MNAGCRLWEAWKQVCKLKLYAEMPLWFCRMAEEMSFEEMEMFRGKHDDSAWFVLEGPTIFRRSIEIHQLPS
jgi:hypothetical protein